MATQYNGVQVVVPERVLAFNDLSPELQYISTKIANAGYGHFRFKGQIRYHRYRHYSLHCYDMPGHPGLVVIEDSFPKVIRSMLTPDEAVEYILHTRPPRRANKEHG